MTALFADIKGSTELMRDLDPEAARAIVPRSEDDLNRLLNDLQLVEFIYEQPAVGDIEYIFKHALTQEVAYNSVLMERRHQLHERTAAALERRRTVRLPGRYTTKGSRLSRRRICACCA